MSSVSSATIGPDLRAALVAMVRKRVPESEVEDIVQATLADAIESPHAPTDSESLRRWIFGVAKNKVVDYHRRAGRETFEVPDVPGKSAPHAEADLLRWAEKHLPPGDENKTTLDWMLREGEGEKLEWIAESEKVPAPRVRQRVSRLRRHLKDHWQKEVALLAAFGVLITTLVLVLRPRDPEPIANEDLPRAAEIRKHAFEKCLASEWKDCLQKLDDARRLDPAGDTRPEVRQARENAEKALTLPPPPHSSRPPEDVGPSPSPAPTSSDDSPSKAPMPKDSGSVPTAPVPTGEATSSWKMPAPPQPAPKTAKPLSSMEKTSDFSSEPAPVKKPMPKGGSKTTGTPDVDTGAFKKKAPSKYEGASSL